MRPVPQVCPRRTGAEELGCSRSTGRSRSTGCQPVTVHTRRLGAARARRRTLAAGSGPPLAARRLRFAILASLAAEPGSRTRAAPRCPPRSTGFQPVCLPGSHGTRQAKKPTGRKAAGARRWARHLVVVRPTPHGVGLVRQVNKPTGRKAAGAPRWTRLLVAVRPTPHGVGLIRQSNKPTGRMPLGARQPKMTVRFPWRNTRSSSTSLTALASTSFSTSLPARAIRSGVKVWSTGVTS